MMQFIARGFAGLLLVLAAWPATAAVQVPPEAQCWFDAVAAADADAAGACMAEDAKVIDGDRTIEGRDAIIDWIRETVIGRTYQIDKITPGKDGVQPLVSWYDPDSADAEQANYAMSLRGKSIASLAITPE